MVLSQVETRENAQKPGFGDSVDSHIELDARREFYEKLYFHGLSARDCVESRLKLPLTVLGLVFAILVSLFTKIVVASESVHWSCWFLSASAFISFCVSVYFLIKAWHGHTYRMLPVPDVLEAYLEDIRLECEAAEEEDEAGEAAGWKNELFSEYLLLTFKEYASHNTIVNARRALWLYHCVATAVMAFALGSASYIPYGYAVYNQTLTEVVLMGPKPEPPPPPPPLDIKDSPPAERPMPK